MLDLHDGKKEISIITSDLYKAYIGYVFTRNPLYFGR